MLVVRCSLLVALVVLPGEAQRLLDVHPVAVNVSLEPLALSALILAQGPYYNLNRHFEAGTGRYLSPESLLQDPAYVGRMAKKGMSVPTYAYANNDPVRFFDPSGLAPVTNYSGQTLDASGNPGPGQGTGPQIPIEIPACGSVDEGHPTPSGVRDVDALGGELGKGGYKIRGNDSWPRWYCYLDVGDVITCLPQAPWLFCATHPNAPSCKKNICGCNK